MSQLKITAVEGLRTQEHASVDWDNFCTAMKDQSEGREGAEIPADDETAYADDFDDMEDEKNEEDEEEGEKSRGTPRVDLNLTSSSRNTSSERLDDSDSQSSSTKPRRKGKARKARPGSAVKPPPLNLYQDQLRGELQYRHHRTPSLYNQDTMSDQEGRRRQVAGRKLQRRGQMKKYRSLEHAVEQAGRDVLEQKFVELEELMSRPLLEVGRKGQGQHGTLPPPPPPPRSLKQHHRHLPAQHRPMSASKKQQQQQQQQHRQLQQKQQQQRLQHGAHLDLKVAEESAESRLKAWVSDSTLDDATESTDRQAYSALRKLQQTATTPAPRNNTNHHHHHQATNGCENPTPHQSLHNNTRLTSKPPVPRLRKTSEDDVAPSNNKTSHPNNSSNNKAESRPQENGLDRHGATDSEGEEDDDVDDDDDRFGNASPRSVHVPLEMHLKYTDNPKLQDWLRQKNLEHRHAKKAERAKKKEERLEKQAGLEKKAALREKSCERVKQWMAVKRKEAARQQKEERRRRRLESEEEEVAAALLRATHNNVADGDGGGGGVRGRRLDRPQSAAPSSSSAKKPIVPIRRPESAARLENGGYMAPKPPDTKFVYKRPVSGRVRLMKVQNQERGGGGKARGGGGGGGGSQQREEEEEEEELSPEEKEKKMRMSYNAWLVDKRKDEGDKRREAKRRDRLARSDPEMDRLVPELAVRRVQQIGKGKKSIDTGIAAIDDDANRRFGGGSFGKEEEGGGEVEQQGRRDSVPEPSSYSLSWEGSGGTTLAELNSRARSTAAKTRMPIPQSTLSPRRPATAKSARDSSPKVKAVMERDLAAEPNPFSLPFSSLHAKGTQMTLSAKRDSSQPGDSSRQEPQGCASVDPTSFPKGVDGSPKPESFPRGVDGPSKLSGSSTATSRSSLVLLQQIEAAAVHSEQLKCDQSERSETKGRASQSEQSTNQSALPSAGEGAAISGDLTPNTGLDEQLSSSSPYVRPRQLFITEPVQSAGAPEDAQPKAGDEAEQERRKQGDYDDDDQEKAAENGRKPSPSNQEQQRQEPAARQEQHTPTDAVVSDVVDSGEQAPERQAEAPGREDSTDSPPVTGEDKQKTESDHNNDSEVPSQRKTEEERRQGQVVSEAEDSPGRCMKRVSFSQDLTTVFQTSSAETSSNFDDERGMDDDEEGEDPYLSLDQVPDPQ